MHNNTELLSPAGTWESLIAAVNNGADAVYLGANHFNARQNAGNFNDEKLVEAIKYCHIRDVKVYLTLNTLIFDSEINELLEVVVSAWNAGIDAIIVQDLGVSYLVRNIIPSLSLHASTQMTIHNLEGVQTLSEIGFSRVVLARELSLEEIKYICKGTDAEIEIFVHGALCVCYSGQCLMSSMIGGRSGNRGLCAQPCRLPYKLEQMYQNPQFVLPDRGLGAMGGRTNEKFQHNTEKYLISLKDLSLIEHLDDIKRAGVKSLKIEGRLKRPEYVAIVTNLYRKYLDENTEVNHEDIKKLLSSFNRSGFTQGYFKGEKSREMVSIDKSNHHGIYLGEVERYDNTKKTIYLELDISLSVGDGIEVWCSGGENAVSKLYEMSIGSTNIESANKGQKVSFRINGNIKKGDKVYKTFDAKLDKELKKAAMEKIKFRTIPLYGNFILAWNKPIIFNIWDSDGNYIEVSGDSSPQKAINKEIDVHTISHHINKTGGTVFNFEDINFEVERGLNVPVSEINNIRRKALELLEKKRENTFVRERLEHSEVKRIADKLYTLNSKQVPEETAILSVQVENIEQAMSVIDLRPERLYLPLCLFDVDNDNRKLNNLCQRSFKKRIEIFCVLPEIFRRNDSDRYKESLNNVKAVGIENLIISNIGFVKIVKEYKSFNMFGDFRLNVVNSFSVICLKELGFIGITASLEMQLNKIKKLSTIENIQKEIVAYGRIPLMIIENCIVNECESCKTNYEFGLRDRKNAVFPIIRDKLACRTKILNSVPVFLGDNISDVINTGISSLRLMFTVEKPEEVNQITALYIDSIRQGQAEALSKHGELIKSIKEKGFTRGHYYKGIK